MDINVNTWDQMYSSGRSLLIYPDETIVKFLTRYKNSFNNGMDVACGAGRHTLLMAQYGIEAIGIDSSSSAIRFAQQRANELGLSNVRFYNARVEDLDISQYEKQDLIIAWGLFHYLNEKEQIILRDKIYDLLTEGGTFLLTLRSVEDTRMQNGTKIGDNQYVVNYFDDQSSHPKKTIMYFWDIEGVKEFLKPYRQIEIGHRTLEPIGRLGIKTSHWLLRAIK